MGCDENFLPAPSARYYTIETVYDWAGNEVGTIRQEVQYNFQIKFFPVETDEAQKLLEIV